MLAVFFGGSASDTTWAFRNVSADVLAVASRFPSPDANKLLDTRFLLSRVGTPTGTLTIDLYSDAGGVPGNKITNIGVIPDVGTMAVSPSYVTVTPSASLNLTPGLDYWVVLMGSWAQSDAHHVTVHADSTNPQANTQMLLSYGTTGGPWVDSLMDQMFEIDVDTITTYVDVTPDLRHLSVQNMFDPSRNGKLVRVDTNDLSLIGTTPPTLFSAEFKSSRDRVLRLDIGTGLNYYELPLEAFANLTWNLGEHLYRVSLDTTNVQKFTLVLNGNDAAV